MPSQERRACVLEGRCVDLGGCLDSGACSVVTTKSRLLVISLLLLSALTALALAALYCLRYSNQVLKRRCAHTVQQCACLATSLSSALEGAVLRSRGSDGTIDSNGDRQLCSEFKAYLQKKKTSRFKLTPFHCAGVCNADLGLVQSMLKWSPEMVATHDTRGCDAVDLAVQSGASHQTVAEMVVRCIQAGVTLSSWHALLERDDHEGYVEAVLDLVQSEAESGRLHTFSHLACEHMKQSTVAQVTSG